MYLGFVNISFCLPSSVLSPLLPRTFFRLQSHVRSPPLCGCPRKVSTSSSQQIRSSLFLLNQVFSYRGCKLCFANMSISSQDKTDSGCCCVHCTKVKLLGNKHPTILQYSDMLCSEDRQGTKLDCRVMVWTPTQ